MSKDTTPDNQVILSVVTPVYNGSLTIKRLIDSIMNQSFQSLEFVIVNDGSEDETASIIETAMLGDDRIKHIYTENSGRSSARNTGVENAQGKFIYFIDADDWIDEHVLQGLMDVAVSQDSDIVLCNTEYVSPDGRVMGHSKIECYENLYSEFCYHCPFSVHAAVTKRDIFTKSGLFSVELDYSEDWDLWQRVLRVSRNIEILPDLMVHYQLREKMVPLENASNVLRSELEIITRGLTSDDRISPQFDVYPGRNKDQVIVEKLLGHCFSFAGILSAHNRGVDVVANEISELPNGHFSVDYIINQFVTSFFDYADIYDSERGITEKWKVARVALETLLKQTEAKYHYCDLRSFGVLRADELFVKRNKDCEVTMTPSIAKIPFKKTISEVKPNQRYLIQKKQNIFGRLVDLNAHVVSVDGNSVGLSTAKFIEYSLKGVASSFKYQLTVFPSLRGFKKNVFRTVKMAWEDSWVWDHSKLHSPQSTDVQRLSEQEKLEAIFINTDPWDYKSTYETEKYELTLACLRQFNCGKVLEIACAEGIFTDMCAPHVHEILAVDISPTALIRAKERNSDNSNVQFRTLNVSDDEIPGSWDIILCTEMMYYLGDKEKLFEYFGKVKHALSDDGVFIQSHAKVFHESKVTPAFSWEDNYGVEGFDGLLVEFGFIKVCEYDADLYKIIAYCKSDSKDKYSGIVPYVRKDIDLDISDRLKRQVYWEPPRHSRVGLQETSFSTSIPVLSYHSISDDISGELAEWTTSTEVFTEHLNWLRDNGYRSISLKQLHTYVSTGVPPTGRCVLLTFDDGYLDFFTHAWPLLQDFGYGAVVFVVAGCIGETNSWENSNSKHSELPLMNEEQLRSVAYQGVELGSHGFSHHALAGLPVDQLVTELVNSKSTIGGIKGSSVTALSYPLGYKSPWVERLAKDSGYTLAFDDGNKEFATFGSNPMCVPRLPMNDAVSISHLFDDSDSINQSNRFYGYVRSAAGVKRHLARRIFNK